ncbi:16S rRNA processing protein RimM [Nannocystis exedens]|uniref:Ribosome maturation factor RimM n=1 Tax=Nannocystis exedens TaxID=54 RepID=A0A1I1UQA2_9BACT|nr:ribosome maturation factor RimM [Nannocystis exedens]PCC71703.1 16S rRNA processing protein RimM [Nannocystis exedens]SFD70160.1 16S rRNA processing protein RimM [Nannocystis exedens]
MPGRSAAIAVAEVSAPHGVRGQLRFHLYDPASRALRRGLRVELRPPNSPEGHARSDMSFERFVILAVEPVPGKASVRVQLDGVTDRDHAERLRGREVWVARADLPALAEDEFYLTDAIGLPVERALADGRTQALGVVAGVTSNGVQDLLEVEWTRPDGRRDTWLLPALPQFIADLDGERLRVELPLGLLPDALEQGGEAS